MTRIDYFYSLASPFTYLAGDRLEQIAERRGAEIAYRPCDMMQVFGQTGGLPPAKRHPSRQAYRLQELQRLSAHAGLVLNLHPKHWPTDPTAASLMVIEAGDDAGAMSRDFLRACWAQERDIADPDTIAAIAGGAGTPADPVAARAAFDANTAEALERGVFGAPFYIVDDQRFWGQDRLDYLDRYLASK